MDVLFDLNGTLLDPAPLASGFPGAPPDLGLSILDDAVVQAMVDTMTAAARPFSDYVGAAIARRAAVAGLPETAVEQGTAAAKALPPYPDAAVALRALHDAGHAPHVLTNSSAEAAEQALEAAGLRDLVGRVLGADAAGAAKPDPRVYQYALEELGLQPRQAWMVAAHWWDVTGAKRANLRSAWIGRDEGVLLSTVPEPDVRAADLASAVAALAAAAH